MKHCVLIQAHKDASYFLEFARLNEQVNFYIHIDKKSTYIPISLYKNVFIVKNPINVNWGGWSQVQATLLLINLALQNQDNNYFHLCSGEDVILQEFSDIQEDWHTNFCDAIMLESEYCSRHQYRRTFNFIHADTCWQRSITGKVLTKIYQYYNTIIPNQQNALYGSSWFSMNRQHAEIINKTSSQYEQSFKKNLCPDEHFFQFLAYDNDCKVANTNKRFIVFDKKHNNGNSPLYLNYQQIVEAKENGSWFARKVDKKTALEFLQKSKYN